MKDLKFKTLKKRNPILARRFFNEMEALLIFFNSPVKNKWLEFIGMKKKEIDSINKFIEIYAKRKVKLEKEKKPKSRRQVIKIEVNILKQMFRGEILKFKSRVIDTEALKIAENILRSKYSKSIILNMTDTDKLATLTGINTLNNFPTDFLVFDVKNKKVIGVNLILK